MDGSTLAVIVIPIVVSLSLAAWLVIVFYAVAHPLWVPRRAHGTRHATRVSAASPAGSAAASRTTPASPRRSPRTPAAAGHRG